MNLTKKKIVVVSMIVSLLAILSLGTLAWFNAKDEVTNKFYVSDSTNPDAVPEFKVEVSETTILDTAKQNSTGGYDYEWVVPGAEISKVPVVKNAGNYNQWIRVNILISKDFADQVAEAQNTTFDGIDFTQLFGGFNARAMESGRDVADKNTYTDYYVYAYYLSEALKPEDSLKVFDSVKIPASFTQDDMNYGTDGFQIIVKAEAIQAANTGTTASEAFKTTANWNVGTDYSN